MTIEEFTQIEDFATRKQDFVAIDRFTGGAADEAKFDARYADAPTLQTRLTLHLDGLKPEDVALLALALRDVCEGKVTFGFGASKGYGIAKGGLSQFRCFGVKPIWNVPATALGGTIDANAVAWFNENLRKLQLPSSPTVEAPVETEHLRERAGSGERSNSGSSARLETRHIKVAGRRESSPPSPSRSKRHIALSAQSAERTSPLTASRRRG